MPTEHTYPLTSSHGSAPWITLKVLSDAPNSQSLPLFLGKQPITGSVILDLSKHEDLHRVVLHVNGKVVSSGIDAKTFLHLREVLYEVPEAGQSLDIFRKHGHQKLYGHQEFKFSVNLPDSANGNANDLHALGLDKTNPHPLPPTLPSKDWGAMIEYELQVHVHRGGLLNPVVITGTYFGYTPLSTPPPPSTLRQEAYAHSKLPPGPSEDPEGWEVHDVHMTGSLQDGPTLDIACSVAIAKPLNYTRGSTIPLFLTLSSPADSSQPSSSTLLSLLSNPTTPQVELQRKLKSHIGVDDVGSALALTDEPASLAVARWWKDDSIVDEVGTNSLRGEIRLPGGLVPSFTWGDFNLKYAIDVYPFRASAWHPSTPHRLLRVLVDVSTSYPPGPRPVSYFPPNADSVTIATHQDSTTNGNSGLHLDPVSTFVHGQYLDESGQTKLRVL